MNNSETKDAILQALANIPEGKICSYGMVARLAGAPGYARYVGYLLKNLPDETTIPWHRVVNSKGQCAFAPGSENYQRQVTLLLQEGVDINNDTIPRSPLPWFAT